MSKCRILCFTLLVANGFCAVAKPKAGELLDSIIRTPGHWSQMCASPPPISFDVPLPLYCFLSPRFHSLSEENLRRLRERQKEIGEEIVSRLSKFDFSKVHDRKPDSFSSTESNQDPYAVSAILLEIIFDLKLVETLPELLRLEDDLSRRLSAATDGGKLPDLDSDSPMMWEGMETRTNVVPGERRLFAARIYQRELLAIMAALLRHLRFQPLLESDFEERYHAYLKRAAEGEDLRHIKTPNDIPRDQLRWITFDPIYQLPARSGWWSPPTMPYSQETRSQLRKFVETYLAQRPRGPAASPSKR